MNNGARPQIQIEVLRYSAFRARLLAELPDLDEDTLADTLEGITDLREMLAELVRSALEDEALAGALSTRLSDMKARLERLEARAKRKRQLALEAMTEAEIKKIEEADFTASLRQGAPTLEVVAEDKIPVSLLEAAASKARPPRPARGAEKRRRHRRRGLGRANPATQCEDQVKWRSPNSRVKR